MRSSGQIDVYLSREFLCDASLYDRLFQFMFVLKNQFRIFAARGILQIAMDGQKINKNQENGTAYPSKGGVKLNQILKRQAESIFTPFNCECIMAYEHEESQFLQ